jgi:hypothetical protein
MGQRRERRRVIAFLHALAVFPITTWLRWCEWRQHRRIESRAMYLTESWRAEFRRLRELD